MKEVEIKDISGKIRFSTPINKGAKGKFTLMKEDYIILPFSVAKPIAFKMGDYVDLSEVLDESLGGKLSKIYEIVDLQKPTYNSSTGGYDYELKLDAYYWKWKNKIFKYTPENAGSEASWTLTAGLDVQLGVFLRNLKALGYTYKGKEYVFEIDSTVENKAVAMTYDNINLLDALFSMAGEDKWNCDCWVEENVIHFGRNEFGDAVKIERDIEASSITRSESQGTYATRIYAFGGTRNIPSNYGKKFIDTVSFIQGDFRFTGLLYNTNYYLQQDADAQIRFLSGAEKDNIFSVRWNSGHFYFQDDEVCNASVGDRFELLNYPENVPDRYLSYGTEDLVVNGVVQKRLMMPADTPYIDVYPDMSQEEAVESIVVFDDIYPKRVGTMSDVNTVPRDIKEDDKIVGTFDAYQYKDAGLVFDEKYLIEGTELKITFQSGKMNGMEFGVIFDPNDKDEQLWEIVRSEDYGRPLPDEYIHPENGDQYVLSGFNIKLVSDQYIPSAEQELKERAQKYADKTKIDDGTYPVTLRSDWVKEDLILRTFGFGQRINLVDDTFFENGRISRVLGWEMNLDIPWDSPVYTIGESMPYSRIEEIEEKVDSIIYNGQTYNGNYGGGGSYVYVIKTNDSTSPTDSNVFSALRSLATFLRKDKADSTKYLLTMLSGAIFGDNKAEITAEGVAIIMSAIINGGKAKIDSDGTAKFLSILLGTGIETENFSTGALGTGFCLKKDENGDTYLEVDRALFRKSATFIEVLIQSLRYVGGQIILSPASMSCSLVEDKDTFYRCYFNNTDGDKTIKQEFVVGDQARSQTFNIKEGVSQNVSNTYYWRLVVGVGDDYIDLSKSDCDAGSTVPSAGDDIVQLGNRNDATRQAAIVLAAYGNDAPYIKMYKGINSYVMDGKEFFTASRSGVRINSDMFMLSTQNGNQSVGGLIKNAVDGIVISGVNILPDSDNGFLSNLKVWPDNASKYSYTNNNGWRRINLLAGNFTGDQIVQEKYITTETGRDLTFSVLVRTNGTITSKPYFRFRDRNTVHSKDVTAIIEPRGQNTYRLWATCSGGLSDNLLVFQIMNFATSGASYVGFRYPQLEYGNKPTEWRESPADLGAKLQVLDDRITAEVHSLEVANRNLLVGSDISLLGKAQGYKIGSEWYVTPHKTDDGWWRINCPNGITDGEFFIEETVSLLQNLTYTESIEMRSDSNSTAALQFYSIYGTYPVSQVQQVSLGSNHWRLIASFKVLYNAGVRKIDVAHISAPKATYVEFRFPMLTEGERYIPWQPALEDETDTRTYLTKHDSEINQLSNEITLRVTKTEYDQNNNEIGKKFSEIRQTAESISLKVDESIGGINLIDNSSFSQNLSGWNINDSANTIASIVNTTALGGPCLLLSTKKTYAGIFRALSDQGKCYIKEGAVFTTSFDLYKESSLPSRLRVGMEDKGLTDENILDISGHPLTTWKRVTVTQTMKSTSASFIIYAMSDQMSNVFIRNLKVERGSVATPWIGSENERLLSTGIDILNKRIVVTTDQFLVRNNKGEQTCKINADGVIETNGGVFKNITLTELLYQPMKVITQSNYSTYAYIKTASDGSKFIYFDIEKAGLNVQFNYYNLRIETSSGSTQTLLSLPDDTKYIGCEIQIINLYAGEDSIGMGILANHVEYENGVKHWYGSVYLHYGEAIKVKCIQGKTGAYDNVSWIITAKNWSEYH